MAQAQEHAETSLEDAEGIIARGLAGLPEVAAAYCVADGGALDVTVLHDYGRPEEGFARVGCQMAGIMRKIPHFYIRTMIRRASKASPVDTRHEKLIYAR